MISGTLFDDVTFNYISFIKNPSIYSCTKKLKGFSLS